ncbi:type II secretion system F family protein [Nocardioides mesophilus]|uniref:Type II secretion system F family protein n=1 Tax=Nocardioides mesophilus TaxID=433659 RepID=A0A7G9RD84_9ACTN|nr:type II secretion system F family protein [Nocardioides mesophilus]QNN53559.1 type II secretion system F family protein [Nocardioides mesophilus]
MGLVVGLGVGIGLLLVWMALSSPDLRPARGPGRLRRTLDAAGLSGTSTGGLLAVCAVSAAVAFLAVQVVSRTATVAAAFGLLAGYLPLAVVGGRARRRQRELAEVWPEAVDNLASAVRAGLSLPEALIALGQRGPEPLREAFIAFGTDYQVTGRFGECLDRLKDRLADPVGDRVVEGLRIAREVGGGELGSLLRNLSGYLRDDARTRSELESRQTWTVVGARLAVAAPWMVLLLLSFQGDVITRYASTAGAVVLGVGGGLSLVAYRLMVRIGRLPLERRIAA